VLSKNILVFIFTFLAIYKSQLHATKPSQSEGSLSIKFNLENLSKPKNIDSLGELSFEGGFATKLSGDYKKTGPDSPDCDFDGSFKKNTHNHKLSIRALIKAHCRQNDKTIDSEIGPFFIPYDQFASFQRKIYLNDQFVQVTFKVNSLTF